MNLSIDTKSIISISANTGWREKVGHIKIRLGIGRFRYRVEPGVYSVGTPKPDSPVLVTANYKLTFDLLRGNLAGIDAWILVLDTKGINVWCAAGKGTFSTDEIVKRIADFDLKKIVNHKELIVPQLGAPGVSAHEVQRQSGFKVIYGPVRASDIKRFLDNDKKVDSEMKDVTFTTFERLILTPLEVTELLKPFTIWILLGIFLISGISPQLFSPEPAFLGLAAMCVALFIGIFLGAFITPILLPWIPGRSFAWKGFIIASIVAWFLFPIIHARTDFLSALSLCLAAVTISSFSAMNFTGSTPFTSPSGV
ncbi:MAG: hypothetical protein HN337_05165, partial [Deltaproteobacteria bacterium]|nr:hypothetical protein [Deltaproteobacteria bacterium]